MPTREFPQLCPERKQGHSPDARPHEDDGRQDKKLNRKPPKGSTAQQEHIPTLQNTDKHTPTRLAELFPVSRTILYRDLHHRSTERPVHAPTTKNHT